jgi:hypothetical protein
MLLYLKRLSLNIAGWLGGHGLPAPQLEPSAIISQTGWVFSYFRRKVLKPGFAVRMETEIQS